MESSFRTISLPTSWPSPPGFMSFSTLLELEACPRRWALSAARYQDVWHGLGYPKRPNLAALRGEIVHNVISLIAKELSQHPITGRRVSQVLRDLGGFTIVFENTIKKVLQRHSENPRVHPIIERISDQLTAEIPELRLKSQELLARVNFDRYATLVTGPAHADCFNAPRPLTTGVFSELEVKSAALAWHGFIDLLSLSSDACEIRDFKSGKQKEEHIFQLYAYALLWLKDSELNPNGRPATRLAISYLDDDVEVPAPGPADYPQIESSIRERTALALMSIQSMPPKAIVGSDNCSFCQVRHLCDEYWDAQLKCSPKLPICKESRFIDIQVLLISRRGPSSWDAKVQSSYFVFDGRPVLVFDQTGTLMNLQEGKMIRLLNVCAPNAGDEAEPSMQPLSVNFGNYSEYFILP
jgi:CRISPR/Cas system-associated exonuclease Cas4 (RecB family)